MSHAEITARSPVMHPLWIIALLLAGVTGFVAGQSWPANLSRPQVQDEPILEDWHGNVRRSHWSK
ncbi:MULTISPECIES: hypothetical protein [unclassified Ruegeria]|uniref:hypothetical protein n=1 Tax=unclassified Ruegeria TaxID=2625375 RepID=UPI0014899DA5|nr:MULTISPECIES: hypothetical protein [unclassified Ruegeria]NOD77349.1 hypothetical protein [Ruegeria sp. HKCCD4332]NOD87772.1 hypothetical protein [Ruegeria sp. HKCCD4318]NOE14142.1 hypothetical protein [Ruegeria sp. HKCCD4318-2]NOG08501.1 hypothetical protein [Ruegeria sp. HKCCD4315]